MDPRALNELMPDWKSEVEGKPWITAATKDRLCFLTEQYNVRLPVMPQLSNKGCYVLSLRCGSKSGIDERERGMLGFSALCRWMASKAEELGVDIFPGFAAAHVLHNSDGSVGGVQIRDRGDSIETSSQKQTVWKEWIRRGDPSPILSQALKSKQK